MPKARADSDQKRLKGKLESALMVSIECLELLGKAVEAEKVRRVLQRQIKVSKKRGGV